MAFSSIFRFRQTEIGLHMGGFPAYVFSAVSLRGSVTWHDVKSNNNHEAEDDRD